MKDYIWVFVTLCVGFMCYQAGKDDAPQRACHVPTGSEVKNWAPTDFNEVVSHHHAYVVRFEYLDGGLVMHPFLLGMLGSDATLEYYLQTGLNRRSP